MRSSFWWLLWLTWCLPQTALGAIVAVVTRLADRRGGWRVRRFDPGVESGPRPIVVASAAMYGGISLGPWIVHQAGGWRDDDTRHEFGHCLQSLMLGPLYLPVVGVPSFLRATAHAVGLARRPYRDFWTERWADRLGRVG